MNATLHALLAHLQADGFLASIDDDGDLQFKYEGKHYALCFDADDAAFSKLILPNVWQLDCADDFQRALAAADDINRRLKLVKVYTVRDQLWVSMEIWMEDVAGWRTLLPRAMRATAHALHLLSEQMRQAPALPAAPWATAPALAPLN